MPRQPVTMRTLAKELGLSLSAVSKALNDYPDIGTETKKLVLGKAAELGYTPNILARSLARKSSSSVGVVLRDVSSVYGEMYKSLNEVARRHALHLILYDTNNDRAVEKWCVQNLIDSMAMGIVISPVSEETVSEQSTPFTVTRDPGRTVIWMVLMVVATSVRRESGESSVIGLRGM